MKKEPKKYSEYSDENIEWSGKFPKHWNSTKLKHLCILQRGFDLPSQDRQEGEFPIYGGGGVTGYHSKAMVKPPGIVTGRYGTIGEIFLVNEPFWPLNTSLYVKEFWGNFPGFIRYLLAVVPMQIYSEKAAVPGINRNIIHQIPVAIPPLEEQEAIATYLDTKTAQIDRKIDLLTQKAQRYEELKRSLINETVTRGLDKTVPMKDSGIEWIGEIPEHWKITAVTSITTLVSIKNHPNEELLSVYRDYGVLLKKSRDDNHNRAGENLANYKLVEPGFLVINKMKTWQGSLGISEFRGIVSPAYITCKTDKRVVKRGYLHHLLRCQAYINEYNRLSYGVRIDQWDMRYDDFKYVPVILPPLSEQNAIAEYLDTRTAQIQQVVQTINTQIEKLQELRKTLINDVVTGKIKVA